MSSPAPIIAALCLGASLASLLARNQLADAAVQRQEDLSRSQPLNEALPSVRSLHYISLGYREVVADYYWLRAIDHFGRLELHEALYPDLEPFIRRVVALDPYFASAYVFAGTGLTLNGMDRRKAADILELGIARRPDRWRIHFLHGFVSYHYLGRFRRAAASLARAAEFDDAPPPLAAIAATVAAHAGTPEVGLRLLDAQLRQTLDDKVRASYAERRRLLQLEQQILWLETALTEFHQQHGQPATTLEQLLEAGLLRRIPSDPFSGSYFVSSPGRVSTTSKVKRLGLKPRHLFRGDP